jgi:YVTN family beta-propeller protein
MRRWVLLPVALVLALACALVALRHTGQAAAGRGHLYVANLRSSDVSVIDLATGRETARVPVAENPHELTRALGGVVVSNYRSGTITPLADDATTGDPIQLGGEPHGLAVTGDILAVTLGRVGRVALLDARTGAMRAEVETGGEPHMAAAVAGRVYVIDAAGNVLLAIDPMAASVIGRVAVGQTPESVAVSPDGRTVAVADARSGDLSLVDSSAMAERTHIPVPGAPVRVAYSPDGRTLAASLNDAGTVALLDADGGLRTLIPVGERPDGLAFSPDGRFLYVALSGDRRVAEVRLADHRVVRMIATGDGPSGLLLIP